MLRRVLALLDRHWFAPASLRDLAVVRIVVFASQTLVFLWYPVTLRDQLLQTTGATDLYQPLLILRVLLAPFGQLGETPPSAMFLIDVYVVAIVAGVLATIGLFSRVSMLAATAANVLLQAHHYSYGEFHHAEALMMIALGVLAVGPSAEVWSVDAVRRRRRSGRPLPEMSVFARWPLRLIQWMLALIYLSAAWAKLGNGGLAWFNGHTMTVHYVAIAIEKDRAVPAYFATLPPKLHIAPSVIAWLVEATFFVAILVPRLAWVLVVGGATLHLAVFATMGITFLQNILLYSVFLESLRIHAPFALVRRGRRGSPLAEPVAQVPEFNDRRA
jgi:hypothetical protein